LGEDEIMENNLNCWEYKNCSDSINCPVKNESIANGLNGGINGGRICWIIMENHSKKKAKTDCFQCQFHYKVMNEEGLLNNCNAIGIYLSRQNNHNSKAIDTVA